MARLKTEHTGRKNDVGYFGSRGEAKGLSKKARRAETKGILKSESAGHLPEIDVSIIEFNLSLTHEERIANHERSRRLADDLRQAGTKAYGDSKS